jgi:hypothetical protein
VLLLQLLTATWASQVAAVCMLLAALWFAKLAFMVNSMVLQHCATAV